MNILRNNKKINELIKKRNLIEIQKYINSNDFITYNFNKGGYFLPLSYGCFFKKTDDYKEIDYKGEEYKDIEKMLAKGLFKIDDNKEAINNIVDGLKPFTLYEYFITEENLLLTYWTTNKENKHLTGNVKLCYPMFYAYKLEETILYNRCVKSPLVSDLNKIKDEYPYIKNNFYTFISKDIGLELDEVQEKQRKLVK